MICTFTAMFLADPTYTKMTSVFNDDIYLVGVVSFTLYSWGRGPWYPLGRRLGGFQSQSECHGERKFLTALAQKF
jgi:hypothetical protein